MKKFKKLAVVLSALAVIGSATVMTAQARDYGYFEGFKVTYSSLG